MDGSVGNTVVMTIITRVLAMQLMRITSITITTFILIHYYYYYCYYY